MNQDDYNSIVLLLIEPKTTKLRQVRNFLLQFNFIEVSDLIQDLAVRALESPEVEISEAWAYEILREYLNILVKQLDTISLDHLIEQGFDFASNNTFKQTCSLPQRILYNTILSYDILDETDIAVLRKEITRREAADQLGIEYDTYKKRLQRKLDKIRDKNVPKICI